VCYIPSLLEALCDKHTQNVNFHFSEKSRLDILLSITPLAFNRRNTIHETMKCMNLNDITTDVIKGSRAENDQASLKSLHQPQNGCIITAHITNKSISNKNITHKHLQLQRKTIKRCRVQFILVFSRG